MNIFDQSYGLGVPSDYFNRDCKGIVYIAPMATKSHIIGVHDSTLVRITLEHEFPPITAIQRNLQLQTKVNTPIESQHSNVIGALEQFFHFGVQFNEDVIALPFTLDLPERATDILKVGYSAYAEFLARNN